MKKISNTESIADLFMSLSLSYSLVRVGQAALTEKDSDPSISRSKGTILFFEKRTGQLEKTQMIHLHHEPALKTVRFCHEKYAADDRWVLLHFRVNVR